MEDQVASKIQLPPHQVFDVPPRSGAASECFDDDGPFKRTGSVCAHVITAVIASGVLSLAWATAQLGWVAGPTVMFLFSLVTYYTSTLLPACYRSGDPITEERNYAYMDAVRSNLGGFHVKFCGWVQYLNLFGVAIGYTIASAISMMAIKRSNCYHESGGKNPCHINSNPYIIAFGIVEIIFSQIPDFDQLWWLAIVAAVMSFTYSSIGLGLGIAKVAETGKIMGSLTGISIGNVTQTQKIWRSFQALGDIAFAYPYSLILVKIQDIIRSKPSESKTMKKVSMISMAVTTIFYMLYGCIGYAAFGDLSPENLLTGFGFYNPFWLLDIANAAIVIHHVGAYQVYCRPLFAFLEEQAAERFPTCEFFTKEIKIPIPGFHSYNLKLLRFVWRTLFVITTTIISILFPFKGVVLVFKALGFWPLTVYFPVEMYIRQKNIPKWSTRWLCLQILSIACLIVTIAIAAGSIAGVVLDLKSYKPFSTSY
ncbi:hypothetical protein SLEP1_g2097 [Rubroshorea leprosula]|uniref:Amino acid transporter transmembrane domain-containing protein n=1 Tax=Rubroshorea leprosula TaxID=152421 RepID=A0AAV5HPS9_9ROSI|nr:hypothetical protein SLEP1_g2097 [Rubroshorea leprosula]